MDSYGENEKEEKEHAQEGDPPVSVYFAVISVTEGGIITS